MDSKNWPRKVRETFFGEGKRGRRKLFAPAVQEYLSEPFRFRGPDNRAVYVIIDAIQPLETDADYQLLLQFRLSDHPPPADHEPFIGDNKGARVFEQTYTDKGEDEDEPVYWYPFTSMNSFSQNKENLRSFILANWGTVDEDDIEIAGDLTDREDRLIGD
jgi:hypothetical protein